MLTIMPSHIAYRAVLLAASIAVTTAGCSTGVALDSTPVADSIPAPSGVAVPNVGDLAPGPAATPSATPVSTVPPPRFKGPSKTQAASCDVVAASINGKRNGGGQHGLIKRTVSDSKLSKAKVAHWLGSRDGDKSVPIESYPALAKAGSDEELRVCLFETTEPLHPPLPKAPDGQEQPAANGMRFIVQASGEATLEGIGPLNSFDVPPASDN